MEGAHWIVSILVVLLLSVVIQYFRYPKRNFSNQVVLITGAANGIGRGLAQKCAENGAILILFDINTKGLEKVKEELKTITTVYTYTCDVSDAQ